MPPPSARAPARARAARIRAAGRRPRGVGTPSPDSGMGTLTRACPSLKQPHTRPSDPSPCASGEGQGPELTPPPRDRSKQKPGPNRGRGERSSNGGRCPPNPPEARSQAQADVPPGPRPHLMPRGSRACPSPPTLLPGPTPRYPNADPACRDRLAVHERGRCSLMGCQGPMPLVSGWRGPGQLPVRPATVPGPKLRASWWSTSSRQPPAASAHPMARGRRVRGRARLHARSVKTVGAGERVLA